VLNIDILKMLNIKRISQWLKILSKSYRFKKYTSIMEFLNMYLIAAVINIQNIQKITIRRIEGLAIIINTCFMNFINITMNNTSRN